MGDSGMTVEVRKRGAKHPAHADSPAAMGTTSIEQRLAIEHGATQALAEANGLEEAVPTIVRTICETLGWDCGACWTPRREDPATMHCVGSWGIGSPQVEAFLAAAEPVSQPLSPAGLLRRAWNTGEPVFVRDVTVEEGFRRAGVAANAGLRGAFAFPIKAGAEVIGVMEFFSHDIQRPDPALLDCAAYVSSQIGQFMRRGLAEEELLRFRAAMDMSGDEIYLTDRATMRFIDVNETACKVTGYTREEMLKLGPRDLWLGEPDRFERLYDEVIARGAQGMTSEGIGTSKDGRRQAMIEAHRRALRLGDRWVIVTIARDITPRKTAERAMLRLSRMYAALSATNEAIMRSKSPEELYQRVCDAAMQGNEFVGASVLLPSEGGYMRIAAATGAASEQLRGALISIDEGTPEGQGLVGNAFRSGKPCVSNDFLGDERTRPWHARATRTGIRSGASVPLMRAGVPTGILSLYSGDKGGFEEETIKLLERMADNIVFALDNFDRESDRREAEERVQYLATHDALTALPNRVMFNQILGIEIESARRYGRKFAVLFIDLDRFKNVNDTLGHEAGDALLKEMAARLKAALRASDVVARLGGDEFVVLVREANEAGQAIAVARKILAAAMNPIRIAGQECRVTASIGICRYPADARDEESLMKHADMAMYLAKQEGKNNYQFYSAGIQPHSIANLALETQLRSALERNELTLAYQAKQDLRSGAITGVEALLRWHHPRLGMVSPAQFIPLAEETGLIVPIGKWVLQAACAQHVAWRDAGLPGVRTAVNLSPRQFADPELMGDIDAALRACGMSPGMLELEITESMVMQNPDRVVRLLRSIREMGVRLAVDDFGTGYSSLARLKRFPIDILKVDGSFIRDIPENAEDKAITQAIIAMGKTLGLTVVAEGVETAAQKAFLREHGCDQMQGYFFSKPVLAEEFAALLRSHPQGAA
jgi:diguanylate cyclase (GGDEF)-like protein/PAS domain S-box-containing protein